MESWAPGELVLIGRRQLRSSNSWLHNSARLVKGKPRCTLLVNPADAERYGLAELTGTAALSGQRVTVRAVQPAASSRS
jgi:hypothetical protein